MVQDQKRKMVNEEFIARDERGILRNYKVSKDAKNYKKWFNEQKEENFLYGSRHSNSLMIHNVCCITNNNEILFVFVEGRGYDAPGLDRAQLAEVISKFNVQKAVSLDGGFSANAVFKFPDGSRRWLLNDPVKRDISSSLHFLSRR